MFYLKHFTRCFSINQNIIQSMKTVKYLGISLVILSFLLLIAYFATLAQGTETIDSTAGESLRVPLMTDIVLFWTYILFGAALLVTVSAAGIQFFKSFAANPGKALKSLIPVLLFAAIFVISFSTSDGEKISIIGYEGTQNEGVWVKITDMFLYTIYTLFAILLLSIFGSRIYIALK